MSLCHATEELACNKSGEIDSIRDRLANCHWAVLWLDSVRTSVSVVRGSICFRAVDTLCKHRGSGGIIFTNTKYSEAKLIISYSRNIPIQKSSLPKHMRPTCSVTMRITIPFNVLMRALTSNHTLNKRGLIEVVLKIFQICRYVNLKIYNSNEQETTE